MRKSEQKQYGLSRWTGEFVDPEVERAYLSHVQAETAHHMIIALLMWAALIIMFISADWAAVGNSTAFYLSALLRLSNGGMLLVLAVMVRRSPALATAGWPVTIVAIAGYFLFFLYPMLIPVEPMFGFALMLLMLLSVFVFLPNRILLNTLIAGVGILGTLSSMLAAGVPVGMIAMTALILFWPSAIGYAAALRIGGGRRRAYMLLQQAEQTNRALIEEITRRKRLESELQHQALTDPLTGLGNRRQYELLFNRELERMKRTGHSMLLGIIDLDHFKLINDRFGHDFGDDILRLVAEALKSPLRQSDILGRFGGEEFILILPDTTPEQGRAIAERMREALASSILVKDGERVQVTATFALTAVQASDADIQATIRRADEYLYAGKHQGRDRVMCTEAA